MAGIGALQWLVRSDHAISVVCCHCRNTDSATIYAIKANPAKKVRAGLCECQECHGQFTVRTGSVMESSHPPLNKWALAYRLMASSKKGMSAHQLRCTAAVFGRVRFPLLQTVPHSALTTQSAPAARSRAATASG